MRFIIFAVFASVTVLGCTAGSPNDGLVTTISPSSDLVGTKVAGTVQAGDLATVVASTVERVFEARLQTATSQADMATVESIAVTASALSAELAALAPTRTARVIGSNRFSPETPCPTASVGKERVVATPGIGIDLKYDFEAFLFTSKGWIRLELFDDQAPVTVNNFIHLARCGYYDGVSFHRVIANFMVQGGDPTGTGGGSPGYSIPDEFDRDLLHSGPGTLSMANSGFGTGGSQFFITHNATPHLDGYEANGNQKRCEIPVISCHPVFGRVLEGQEVVDKLNVTGVGLLPDTIETIEIIVR
jgi:cyclophilin family peptidyl-prolyl cis-trans isomerase